jgi:hypothetical protein
LLLRLGLGRFGFVDDHRHCGALLGLIAFRRPGLRGVIRIRRRWCRCSIFDWRSDGWTLQSREDLRRDLQLHDQLWELFVLVFGFFISFAHVVFLFVICVWHPFIFSFVLVAIPLVGVFFVAPFVDAVVSLDVLSLARAIRAVDSWASC